MAYLEYHKETKQVVEIHEKKPLTTSDYAVGTSGDFKAGDEFEQTIWVNSVDDKGVVTSYSAIRNNPHATRLLKDNERLVNENASLWYNNMKLETEIESVKSDNAELWYAVMTGGPQQ